MESGSSSKSHKFTSCNNVLLDKTNVYEVNPFINCSKRSRIDSESSVRGKLLSTVRNVNVSNSRQSFDVSPKSILLVSGYKKEDNVDQLKTRKIALIRRSGKNLLRENEETLVEDVSYKDNVRLHEVTREQSKKNLTHEQIKAEHAEWQRQYRKAFPSFRFYFDKIDENTKLQVKRHLQSLGAHTEPFFCASVTHVITTREIPKFECLDIEVDSVLEGSAYSEKSNRFRNYPNEDKLYKNDVLYKAWSMQMKIWSLDKLVNKVLGNLIGQQIGLVRNRSNSNLSLSNLLREEKFCGTKERDPKTARSDFVTFKGPYVHIRDAFGIYRPILMREYSKSYVVGREPWPVLRSTTAPRSPFILEKRRSVIEKIGIQTTKKCVEIDHDVEDAQKICEPCDILKDSTNRLQTTENGIFFKAKIDTLTARRSSVLSASMINEPFAEMNASGIARSTTTSAIQSITSLSSKSALSGGISVLNQNKTYSLGFNMLNQRILQRRILEKEPITTASVNSVGSEKEEKKKRKLVKDTQPNPRPGYCENCKEKFDDINIHVQQRIHRKFAEDEKNFKQIDEIIAELNKDQEELWPSYISSS